MPAANGHAPWDVVINESSLVIQSKSSRIGLKRPFGEVLGDIGPRWPQEGSKNEKVKKTKLFHPPLWGQIGGKIDQNFSWGDPKGDHFLSPKLSQNPFKLVPKSIEKLIKMLTIFLLDF